jgi:hypothetical protein
MMKPSSLVTVILALANCVAGQAADPNWKASVEKADLPQELQEAIRAVLSDRAIRVEGAGGEMGTFWFRGEVPAKGTPEQVKNGLTYREIPVSTVIGAVRLPKTWTDFRKQEIPKGIYTLRLAIQPMDGDHMGTAPHTDFCLLCPADKDPKPDLMELTAVRELSAMSHDSTHPAVMLLFPNSKPADQPAVVSKGKGIFVLNAKRPVAAGGQKTSLGFGFTIAGQTSE